MSDNKTHLVHIVQIEKGDVMLFLAIFIWLGK